MRSNKLVLYSVLLLYLSVAAYAADSSYTLRYEDGSDVTLYESTAVLPDLEPAEHCNHGVWIIYPGVGFTFGVDGIGFIQILYPDFSCERDCGWYPYDMVRSARPVGHPVDHTIPSTTFYTNVNFGGEEHLIADGNPSIDYAINSTITINADVELFTGYDYTGDSFCLERNPPFCDDNVCFIFDFNEFPDLPFDISLVKSARIGCSSTTMKRVPFATKRMPPFRVIHP